MDQRQIKIRIWDFTDKKWLSILEIPNREFIGMSMFFNHPDRNVYQLSTGLKDKNDIEIYEGGYYSIFWENCF